MKPRMLKIKNTQRNIHRVIKWLGLDCTFSGTFSGRYRGYKLSRGKEIIFVFLAKGDK